MNNLKDVTILIKTFNRKKALLRLLKSIEKYYSNIKIIIVDDSKRNYRHAILKKFKNLDIQYIVTRFDIGLSEGRNILLANTKTKYFLLCDDDIAFDHRTQLDKALNFLKTSRADILGGMIHNRVEINGLYSLLWTLRRPSRILNVLFKKEFDNIYNGNYYVLPQKKEVKLIIDQNISHYPEPKVYRTELCHNFFIANTERIRQMGGWKPESLKVGEHEIFFLRAKLAGIKVVYSPVLNTNHYPKKSLLYMKYRARQNRLFEEAWKKMGYSAFKIVKNDK